MKTIKNYLSFMLITIVTGMGNLKVNADNSWAQKTDFGGSAREEAVGFSIGTKGYIGTGSEGANSTKDFWEWDQASNTWTQKADFGGTARFGARGFSIGAKGYIGTGFDATGGTTDFWEYDPGNNTWTQKANIGGGARYRAVGFSISAKGYIGTGDVRLDSFTTVFGKDFWEYDPNDVTNGNDVNGHPLGKWTQKADFGGSVTAEAVGFNIGTKGYIKNGDTTNNFWEYDPLINIWTQKANFPGTARLDAAGFGIGTKGYIGTGASFGPDLWAWDQITDTWTQKADVGGSGSGRIFAVGFSIGPKGYIGTGQEAFVFDTVSFSAYVKDFWEYSPVSSCSVSAVSQGTPVRCNGGNNGSACVTASGGITPYTYQWSNGGSTSCIQGLTAGTYTVIVTDANACLATSLFTVSQPTALTAVCSGTSVSCNGGNNGSASVIAGGGVPFYTYIWTNGSTNSSITNLTTGTYLVTVRDSNLCMAIDSFRVTQPTVLVASCSSTPASCHGSDGTASIAASGGTPGYTYIWNNGGANTSATTSRKPGSYIAVVTDANGCTTSCTSTVDELTAIGLMGTISGPPMACKGTLQSYSITPPSNTTLFTWTAPLNATITSGQGTNAVKVSYGSKFISGTLSFTASNACGNSSTTSLIIVSVPATPSGILGPVSVCAGTTVSYTLPAVYGATGYTWTAPAKAIIVGTQGTASVTISFSSSFSSGTLSVIANNACGSSSSGSLLINISPPATPGSISGATSICYLPGIQTYSVTPINGATSYAWTAPPVNATIIAGQGTNTVNVAYNSSFTSGTLTVRACNACNSCSGLSSLAIGKSNIPAAPYPISGPANVCINATQTYSVPAVSGVTSYSWSPSANMTIIGGQGKASVTVKFTGLFPGDSLRVIAINACGSSNSAGLAIQCTAAPVPGTISGSSFACASSTQSYSIPAISGASYSWTAPAKSTILSGQGSNAVSVAFNNKFTGGVLSVSTSNICGTGGSSSLNLSKIGCRMAETMQSNNEDESMLSVYPNPAHDMLNLTFLSTTDGSYEARLFDITGRIIIDRTGTSAEGENHIELDLGGLSRGLYILSFASGEETRQVRIVVE